MKIEQLLSKARKLGLYGLVEDWDELGNEPWVPALIEREERVRDQRSLERRIKNARIGIFKPMADFDYGWPRKIDRMQVEDLFNLQWLEEGANVILVGPNGVGKSMIIQNLTYQAVLRGATGRMITAGELLNDLAAQESSRALQRRFALYTRPDLLAIDELGYLSYDHRHADLFFEVVNRRYRNKSILLTTNKPFTDWQSIFSSATCVVSLVDRLVHHAEIVAIDGDSYRRKEAEEEKKRKAQARAQRRRAKKKS